MKSYSIRRNICRKCGHLFDYNWVRNNIHRWLHLIVEKCPDCAKSLVFYNNKKIRIVTCYSMLINFFKEEEEEEGKVKEKIDFDDYKMPLFWVQNNYHDSGILEFYKKESNEDLYFKYLGKIVKDGFTFYLWKESRIKFIIVDVNGNVNVEYE